MATPNYGYEKRQRELAKRRKKEDKARAKAEAKAGLTVPAEGDGALDTQEAVPVGEEPVSSSESEGAEVGAGDGE